MPKKRATPAKRAELLLELAPVFERLARLEAVLNQIERRLEPLAALPAELTACRSLALEAVAQAQDAQATGSLSRVHEDRLNTLTLAVAEGIQHVERAEARIRATVRRSREQLAEVGLDSPSLDAEAQQLELIDGGGSRSGGVPAVPPRVAAPVEAYDDRQASAVPGMTRGQLRMYRGA